MVSVSRMAIYPSFLLTTTQGFEAKTVADVIANAKKNPGKVRYTSAGVGSFPHYDMEVFARRAGIEMTHIPNKTGAAGMINDLVVGDAQVAFLNAASSASMIKSRQAASVAVRAEQRLADYPDVPTLARPASRHRHLALAEHAGTGQYPEGSAGDALQGDRRCLEGALAAGGIRQAVRERQAQ